MSEYVYAPRGILAVDPSALGQPMASTRFAGDKPFTLIGDKAVVRINGPLSYSPCDTQDDYQSILARGKLAIDSGAKVVFLHISSPGGDVNGCFDSATAFRKYAEKAGVRVIAFSDASICSSAYRWACAADEIYVSPTATVGSIGVIAVLPDQTVNAALQGIKFNIITSGERKADGSPMVAMSDESRAAIQLSVDTMAGVFFSQVSERRPQLTIDSIMSLQAGVRIGQLAVESKLADGIATLDELLSKDFSAQDMVSGAADSSVNTGATARQPKCESKMADKEDKKEEAKVDATRAALLAASEDPKETDESKRARAKRALAAYDAEMSEDEDKKDEKKEEASAAVAANASLTSLSASVQSLSSELAKLRAEKVASERAAFFAANPGLAPELVKTFASMPLDQVKAIVAALPAVSNPHVAALETTSSVVGSDKSAGLSYLSPQASALDEQMGIAKKTLTVEHGSNFLTLGVKKVVK